MAESDVRKYSNIKVRNVKKKAHVVLEWREPGSTEDWITRSEDNAEPATEAFYEALGNLAPMVRKWLAAMMSIDPKAVATLELRILGVSYTYKDDGSYTVNVSASAPCPGFGSPLPLNFPKLAPDRDMVALLEDLETEAGCYIDGERGQLEMPLPEEGADVDGTQDELDV